MRERENERTAKGLFEKSPSALPKNLFENMENAKAPFLKKEGFGLYQKLLGNMEIGYL